MKKRVIAALVILLLLYGCGQAQSSETSPASKADAQTSTSSASDESSQQAEQFSGILIDEDCSDFEDPPMHETNCMFMEECRASGYGIDIKQADGSWVFYEFDDRGKELAWEYLNKTDKPDGLYITVTGTRDGKTIKVNEINEQQE